MNFYENSDEFFIAMCSELNLFKKFCLIQNFKNQEFQGEIWTKITTL